MANDTRYSLARIPLRWMIRECFKAKTGIIFDAHMLKYETGLNIGAGPAFEAPPPVLPTSKTPAGNISNNEKNFFSRFSHLFLPFLRFFSLISTSISHVGQLL